MKFWEGEILFGVLRAGSVLRINQEFPAVGNAKAFVACWLPLPCKGVGSLP